MDVHFKNKYLADLYENGKNRKYPLQPQVFNKFSMRIQQLEAAISIHDLWKTSSLKFEKLKNFQNRYSIRIDKKYRLEFDVQWQNKEQTIGIFYIQEISKHYGD